MGVGGGGEGMGVGGGGEGEEGEEKGGLGSCGGEEGMIVRE